MIKINISRDGQITNSGTFPTLEEGNAWVAYHNFSGDIEILDITSQLEQEKINTEAQALLDSTDWIVVRAVERGEEVPAEIKQTRQEARDRIVRL